MWKASENYLSMAEGDYGIKLPFTVSGATLLDGDSIRFTFKNSINGIAILEKEYTLFVNNSAELEFTEEESALFSVGNYVYNMDWYHDGNFMCNLIPHGVLRVVDKV